MEALYLLIPLSTGLVFFAIWLFFKASDAGQFEDLQGPAERILQDDDSTPG
jgi:cbb3-type cytochrome oxidase maturation protein